MWTCGEAEGRALGTYLIFEQSRMGVCANEVGITQEANDYYTMSR